MGAITRDMREQYGRQVDWIPPDILNRLDEDEIRDRLDEATDLMTKAYKAPADLMRGYMQMARILCEAQPRDDTERQAQEWKDKAAKAHTPLHASACIGKSIEIRNANPPAPRRVRHRPTPEELHKAEAVKALQADVAKAAAAERIRQAAEDAKYQDALAGRRQWTLGDQIRYQSEQPA